MHAANSVQCVSLIVHTQMKCNLVFRVINNYTKSWYNYQIDQDFVLLGIAQWSVIDLWIMYAWSKKGLGGRTQVLLQAGCFASQCRDRKRYCCESGIQSRRKTVVSTEKKSAIKSAPIVSYNSRYITWSIIGRLRYHMV